METPRSEEAGEQQDGTGGTPAIVPPWTGPEIVEQLRQFHAASGKFWEHFPTDEFVRPLGEAWSPADNVRHLIKSMRPVASALRLPGPLLGILFGRARTPSRGYEEMRATYQARLAAGGKAGRFAPSPLVAPADPEGWRRELMRRRDAAEAALETAVLGLRERSLDRWRVPHPLLGKLTLREMLFFTLYHGLHHVDNVARRKELASTGSASGSA